MATNDKTGPDDRAAEGSWSPRGNDVTSTKATDDSSSKGSSGGGTPDPDQLVADIERTRENLAETLDAIVEKVNPKRVVEEKKQQAKAEAQEAVKTAKTGAANAAQSVKAAAAKGAEAVKDGVASVKEKIGGDEDPVRSPLTPQTSVEVGAAAPVASPPPVGTGTGTPAASGSPLPADTVSIDAAAVPPEPAPTTDEAGSYAVGRPAVVQTQPAGAQSAPYFGTLPPAVSANAPLIGGVGASVALLLLLVKKRRSRRRRTRVTRGRRS